MRDSSNQRFYPMLSNKLFSQFEPAAQIDLVLVEPKAAKLDLANCT